MTATRNRAPRFGIAECVWAIQFAEDQAGHGLTARDYADRAAGNPDLPSVATICKVLGSWSKARAATRRFEIRRKAT